jgi:hypothetical protein
MKTTQLIALARARAERAAYEAALRPHLVSSPEVRKALSTLKSNAPKGPNTTLSVSVSDFSNSVFVSLRISDLDSLKDPALAKALTPFIVDGTWTPSTTDYTYGEEPNREFMFSKHVSIPIVQRTAPVRWLQRRGFLGDSVSFHIEVRVSAYVKADSAACRYEVDVTEEVVRKEVKRIVCA